MNSDGRMNIRTVVHMENGVFESNPNGVFSGAAYFVLQDIEFMSNLSFNFTNFVEWDATNSKTDDPFVDNIVPLLNAGKMDLLGSYYYYVQNRITYPVVLLTPLVTESFRVFFRQPSFAVVKNIYLEPFGKQLLYAYFSMMFLLLGVIIVLIWKSNQNPSHRLWESFKEGIWWVVTFCGLKNYSFPYKKSISLRVISITSALFFYIMYSIYSAFLISSLTSNFQPIKSFVDLINFGYSFYGNPSLTRQLLTNQNHVYKKPEIAITNSFESFKLAMKGGHVHVDHADTFKIHTDLLNSTIGEMCKIVSILPFVSRTTSGFYAPKNSSIREVMNSKIAKLWEVGLLQKYKKGYVGYVEEKVTTCPKSSLGYQDDVGLSQVSGIFILLGIALPIVTFVFVLEWIYKKYFD